MRVKFRERKFTSAEERKRLRKEKKGEIEFQEVPLLTEYFQ